MSSKEEKIELRRRRVWELHKQGCTTAQIMARLGLPDRQVLRDVKLMREREGKLKA